MSLLRTGTGIRYTKPSSVCIERAPARGGYTVRDEHGNAFTLAIPAQQVYPGKQGYLAEYIGADGFAYQAHGATLDELAEALGTLALVPAVVFVDPKPEVKLKEELEAKGHKVVEHTTDLDTAYPIVKWAQSRDGAFVVGLIRQGKNSFGAEWIQGNSLRVNNFSTMEECQEHISAHADLPSY